MRMQGVRQEVQDSAPLQLRSMSASTKWTRVAVPGATRSSGVRVGLSARELRVLRFSRAGAEARAAGDMHDPSRGCN